MRRRKIIFLAFLSIIALLAGLEIFCRLYLGLGDPPLVHADPEMGYLFIGPRTYHRFGNTIMYNRFSMRSREFDAQRKDPNEIRILVVGNSVINGGALTDHSLLMTTRLERRLVDTLHKPTIVMNVSAGGWGPPNYWAYIRRYGLFESNVLVIVTTPSDYCKSLTFDPLDSVDFPVKTPVFALSEAIIRYLPRYLHLPGRSTDNIPVPEPSQGQIDQAMSAFRALVAMARDHKIPVIVLENYEKTESNEHQLEGHRWFMQACQELGVPRIEMLNAYQAALRTGHDPYRDQIHPNAVGQQLMEEAIEPAIMQLVR